MASTRLRVPVTMKVTVTPAGQSPRKKKRPRLPAEKEKAWARKEAMRRMRKFGDRF